MSSINAVNYSRCVHIDKIRILFPNREADYMHVLHAGLIESAGYALEWSPEYARKHIRIEPYFVKGQRAGYYLQLTYKAAELVYTMPFNRAHNATEVEVKAYVCDKGDDAQAYYHFCDALYTIPGSLNTYFVTNGTRTARNKAGAQKAPKVGSNKSATQAGLYKRQGQKAGLEVAVRKKRIRAIAETVQHNLSGVEGDGTQRHLWDAFIRSCARVGFYEFEKELIRRGIQLRDYFEAFSTEAHAFKRSAETELPIAENGAQLVQLDLFGGES